MTLLSMPLDKTAMKPTFVKSFLIWVALLNWPPLLFWIPSLLPLTFLPYLFWINIPALFLGLAKIFGPAHYDVQEFGAIPQTVFAWTCIVVFWLFIAAMLTAMTGFLSRRLHKMRTA